MKTIEIKGYIHAVLHAYTPDEIGYHFSACEDMSFMNSEMTTYVLVQPHTVVAEIPDREIDYRTVRVAALEKEREKVRAELGRRITEINNEISKLQALTFDPA
ncbi:hypothetical protein ACI2VH_02765 [Ralstonia nicotianae]